LVTMTPSSALFLLKLVLLAPVHYAFLPSISNFQLPKQSAAASSSSRTPRCQTQILFSTADTARSDGIISPSPQLANQFLAKYQESLQEGHKWAKEFGFSDDDDGSQSSSPEGSFFAIFRAIQKMDSAVESGEKLLGLNGTPFYVPAKLLAGEEGHEKNAFSNYFHFGNLALALEEDFLDAQRGSTDNRKGWQVAAVSQPTGSSFNEARMTLPQVQSALEKGTVIFNNIGAHIPHLAGPTLACTDALSLPGALNMYVTAKGMRTSAPPHTDRQDVLVVQMEGAKRWRVFSPPTDGKVKPTADPFARGKGDDSLPLHVLLEEKEGRLGTELLMDVVTREGDVLFIPAGFPHTTDTVEESVGDESDQSIDTDYDNSIHLTFNVDTHVWDLDYLSVRSVALKRNRIEDVLMGPSETNRYTGKVNQLPDDLRADLMDALPLAFLENEASSENESFFAGVAERVKELCAAVNDATNSETVQMSPDSFKEAIERIRAYGTTILDIHRDMYLAAIEEGRLRKAEAAMTAHLKPDASVVMTPERMQRLSLFRVRPFFEQIDTSKKDLERWCLSGATTPPLSSTTSSPSSNNSQLDPNWHFTSPLKVGDEVEADLGGAFFEAKVSQIVGNTYNVVFFDGDRADGLKRD